MVLGILQARTASSRLPGKVLMPILDIPMVQHQIQRIQRSGLLSKLVLATSNNKEDDELYELAGSLGIDCYRGSLNDVLDRFYQAAKTYEPDHVVRLTGDCPLADASIIDQCIQLHINTSADYTSNIHPPTYPDGLDVEILQYRCLETLWKKASSPQEREHVTLHIANNPDEFLTANLECKADLSHLRWTVDMPEDFRFVCAVYEKLFPLNIDFSFENILDLLSENPELAQLNHQYQRNFALEN